MPIDYESLAFRKVKELAESRGLNLAAVDARTKEGVIKVLREDDLRASQEAEQAAERILESEEAKKPAPPTELERVLQGRVPTMRVRGPVEPGRNLVEEALRVRNLPADYVHGWASLASGGEDVATWVSLGWIRATTDMVTNDPTRTDKIFVNSYDPMADGTVRHKDTLLMIASRRIVEDRERGRVRNWNEGKARTYGGVDGGSKTGYVKDPSQTSGATFQRTGEWRPEDMYEEDGGG